MKRLLIVLASLLVVAAVFGGVALASGPVTAQAPNARLAVLIDGNNPTGTFTVIRKKGVAMVTNPLDGVFCIKPSNAKVNVGRIVPNVTTEWHYTKTVGYTQALWDSAGASCPAGTIEVNAITSDAGQTSQNDVGFSVTVF